MWHIRERARLSSPSLESSEQLIFFATFWRRCPEGAAFDPTNGLITQLTKTALSWDSRAPCSLRFLTPNLLKTNYGGLPCRCDRVLLALLDGHSPIRSRWSTVAFALACGPTLKSRSTAHAPKGLWLSAIQPEGLFLLQHDVDRPHQLSCGCHDGDLLPPSSCSPADRTSLWPSRTSERGRGCIGS